MFVATIVIVIILIVMIIASGIVKEIVRGKDNVGVQNEAATGLDDVFDYADEQFNYITKLRVKVVEGGWEELLGVVGK